LRLALLLEFELLGGLGADSPQRVWAEPTVLLLGLLLFLAAGIRRGRGPVRRVHSGVYYRHL